MVLAVMKTAEDLLGSASDLFYSLDLIFRLAAAYSRRWLNRKGFRHGLLPVMRSKELLYTRHFES